MFFHLYNVSSHGNRDKSYESHQKEQQMSVPGLLCLLSSKFMIKQNIKLILL